MSVFFADESSFDDVLPKRIDRIKYSSNHEWLVTTFVTHDAAVSSLSLHQPSGVFASGAEDGELALWMKKNTKRRNRRTQSSTVENLERRDLLAAEWSNPDFPWDVNHEKGIAPK